MNSDKKKEALDFIIQKIIEGERDLEILKREVSRKFTHDSMIKNPDILEAFPKDKLTKEIRLLLLKKPTKTLSGVTPIAVMIKPQNSCKWACIYCPFTGLAAKSNTGFEPAALRSRQYNYDSFLQTNGRVKQFQGGGHPTDKCEVIVMGGTFLEMDEEYKTSFIKGIYDALNETKSETLEEAVKFNENAKNRAIGLTIETRPDVCIPYINQMLSFGATRVELGVQHADDQIYQKINRGHSVKDVVDSTKALKDCAFKVLYHVMPGLPGADRKKDIGFVKTLFEDQRFQPDMIKIYPTLVVGGTILSKMEKEGKYTPYSSEEAADIISEFYRYIPKYVRVMRIQRDIPANKIEEGVKKSNLRELVEEQIRKKGIKSNEIRTREVGLLNKEMKKEDFSIKRIDYEASQGKEVFLSMEDNEDDLAGFIRLRIPSKSPIREEITSETGLIRELHIYGSEVPISKEGSVQHSGFGSTLLKEAERIAHDEFGMKKMIIISGVGVREYYKKHKYVQIGPYVGKDLK